MNVFDPRAKWLIEHQDARPYGDEMVSDRREGGRGRRSGRGAARRKAAGGRRASAQLSRLAANCTRAIERSRMRVVTDDDLASAPLA